MGRVVTELSTYDSRVSAAQHQKVKVKKPFVVIHVHAYMDSTSSVDATSKNWKKKHALPGGLQMLENGKYIFYVCTSSEV